MRTFYICISMLLGVLVVLRTVSADSSIAFSARLKHGMSVSDVVATLGEPQGRVEMETKRETLLVYPKGSLRFIDGHLAIDSGAVESGTHHELSRSAKSVAVIEETNSSQLSSSQPSKSGAAVVGRQNDPDSAVKLESVLNEVMNKKENSSDNFRNPSVFPVAPGMPGSASMGSGIPPAPPVPPFISGSPYGNMQGGIYQDEDAQDDSDDEE